MNEFVPKNDSISAFTQISTHRSFFCGMESGHLFRVELRSGLPAGRLQAHKAAVSNVVHTSASELLLSASYDGCVFVHGDTPSQHGDYPLLRRINFKDDIRSLAFMEADSLMMIGSSEEPLLWDVQRVALVGQLLSGPQAGDTGGPSAHAKEASGHPAKGFSIMAEAPSGPPFPN